MFFKKPNPSPRGVPLDVLEQILKPTTLRTSRDRDALVVKHEKVTTRVDVAAPKIAAGRFGRISAIVSIRTELPAEFAQFAAKPGFVGEANAMATLGAITEERGRFFVGSRLTVFEGENAWRAHLPLMATAVITGAEAIFGSIRRSLTKAPPRTEQSAWSGTDFEFVQSYLSKICVCAHGTTGLTAEFGLGSGEISAAAGHRNTALWQLLAEPRHPAFGGGLLCVLTLPHQIADASNFDRVIGELNRIEMADYDRPPHFGAWCRDTSNSKYCPKYVSFLPNGLHDVEGIAVNVSIWAMHRAKLTASRLSPPA